MTTYNTDFQETQKQCTRKKAHQHSREENIRNPPKPDGKKFLLSAWKMARSLSKFLLQVETAFFHLTIKSKYSLKFKG